MGTLGSSLVLSLTDGDNSLGTHHSDRRLLMSRLLGSSVLFLLVAVVASSAFASGSATTLKNLQTAFNGESNANARYDAFAKQADKEGYGQVASLFRAAARAEAIHAANHAVVIKNLGGTPEAKVEKPDVKTT